MNSGRNSKNPSGVIRLLEETIQSLYQFYLENATGGDYGQYEEYQEEDYSQLEADYEYNTSVLEHFGSDGYAEMIGWASENLSPADQAAYDRAMDSADHDYKGRMIGWLADIYQNSN